jgi:hypothetical protein
MRTVASASASHSVGASLDCYLLRWRLLSTRLIQDLLPMRGQIAHGPHCRWGGSTGIAQKILLVFTVFCAALMLAPTAGAEGITPEQIFQAVINWNSLIGTWEVLPEESPLQERSKDNEQTADRTLMTLRVDGTCRVFDKAHPHGSDGLWTFEDHEMFITFKNAVGIEFYIYGVKADFMVARSPIKGGKDQLWSRIK